MPESAHKLVVGLHTQAAVKADVGGARRPFGGTATAVCGSRIAWRIRIVKCSTVQGVAFLAGGSGGEDGEDGKK